MILEKYRTPVNTIDHNTASAILEMLSSHDLKVVWTPAMTLYDVLNSAGHDHADLVLCLLKLEKLNYISSLMGHEITVCPPCLRYINTPLPPVRRVGDERHIIKARPPEFYDVYLKCKSRNTTSRYYRISTIRIGMSIAQLLNRGVTRHDLYYAQKQGWIEVEQAA